MKAFILIDYHYGAAEPSNVLVVLADNEGEALVKLEALHPTRYTTTVRGKLVLDRSHGFDELDAYQ